MGRRRQFGRGSGDVVPEGLWLVSAEKALHGVDAALLTAQELVDVVETDAWGSGSTGLLLLLLLELLLAQ